MMTTRRIFGQNGHIRDDTVVKLKSHRQVLTQQQAARISGFTGVFSGRLFIAGCGALGSKITLHLARSGNTQLTIADPDTLSPHNFVRHALSAKYVGMNKAAALVKEIDELYKGEQSYAVAAEMHAPLTIPQKTAYAGVLDFTASELFLQELVNQPLAGNPLVARGYISDFGDLGILLVEGNARNPRLDDLQQALYAYALKDNAIAAWLQREKKVTEKEESIAVGVGCNSETTVLSDDIVSLHASFCSGAIKDVSMNPAGEGRIYLNAVERSPYFRTGSRVINVAPFTVLPAQKGSNWQVRFAPGIIDRMQKQLRKAAPKETGGVLVGSADYKTMTVHVVELIDAPPDSRANELCFFRGINGLKAAVDKIADRTGGQVGYIGEWHTHPRGPAGMSLTDAATVQRFRREYDELADPLPVFLTIVTPNQVLPFIY